MADKVSNYLDNIKAFLRIDSLIKSNVTHEIRTHLEDKSDELKGLGLNEEEAAKAATECFGPPQLVAQQLSEVHGQGTWQEAFFAALPHVLMALVFVSHYWQSVVCLASILVIIVCVAIYGWCHNKPTWFFPWLGYYLLPVIITSVLLIRSSQGWAWLGTLAYIPVALFVLACVVKQTANRDWLYVSLMVAPVLVVFSWLVAVHSELGLLAWNVELAQLGVDIPWIVISFLVLGIATVVSVRVRQRSCKAIALLVPSVAILASAVWMSGGNIGFWAWLILGVSLLALAGPTWLELRS